MTNEQIKEICEKYDKALESVDAVRENHIPGSMRHIRWMCKEIIELVKSGKTEKAFRWLGFVQGVLWTTKIFDIEQLKEDNR